MKKLYLMLALLPISGFTQNISVINLSTKDLVYSSATNMIYASIPANSPSNPNSLGMISPATATVENTFPIGNDPDVMAISPDGQTIYTGLKGVSSIRKFLVATNTPGIEFSLGSDVLTGSFYAEDIEVWPGNFNTVAVARRNHSFAPRHEGVAVFDNGIMRPLLSPNHIGANKIAFYADNKLVGLNSESDEGKIRKLDVVINGLQQTELSSQYTIPFDQTRSARNFCVVGQTAFLDNGKIIKMEPSAATIVGTIPDVNGPVTKINAATICFASTSDSGALSLEFYTTSGSMVSTVDIPQAIGKALNVIPCGDGCIAFNTPGQVIIVNNFLATASFDINSIALFPNPVTNQLNIACQDNMLSIIVHDPTGRKVAEFHNVRQMETSIDTSKLSSGAYLVNIATEKGTYTKKIIKQ
jgi:hypothetical protein